MTWTGTRTIPGGNPHTFAVWRAFGAIYIPYFMGRPEFPLDLDPLTLTRGEMAAYARRAREVGVDYVGACCGTVAAHIRAMAEALGRRPAASAKSPRLEKHAILGTPKSLKGRASAPAGSYTNTLNRRERVSVRVATPRIVDEFGCPPHVLVPAEVEHVAAMGHRAGLAWSLHGTSPRAARSRARPVPRPPATLRCSRAFQTTAACRRRRSAEETNRNAADRRLAVQELRQRDALR